LLTGKAYSVLLKNSLSTQGGFIRMKNQNSYRIIITGGSSGIGETIAYEMTKSGSNIYLIGRSKQKLLNVKQKIEVMGGKASVGVGDVADENDGKRLYSDILEKLGGVDVLIANAGVGYFGNLEDLTLSQFDEQFNTNVRGVFFWIKQVLPLMKRQNKGQIIVTSSNLGLKTTSRASIYAATKHAVQAMVGCLRDELKDTQVKAATINPGSVNTPWFDGKDVDRTKMLNPIDVAKAVRLIIDQGNTSNIDHILLLPGYN
jgi:short-subunit dehydrogenase